jgi:NADP-dependent 3-hydroxy acid dehydrogenase YdfG
MIAIIGGLYEGLGLASAIYLAYKGHKVGIFHHIHTSRNCEDVSILEEKLDNCFVDLEIFRYKDVKECGYLLAKYRTEIDTVISCVGQRAYDFTNIEEINQFDLLEAIDRETSLLTEVVRQFFTTWKSQHGGILLTFGYYKDYWNNHLPLHSGHIYEKDSLLFRVAKSVKYEIVKTYSNLYFRHGVRTNIIEPGRIRNLKLEEIVSSLTNDHKISKCATSIDVAYLIEYLISDRARFISGSKIPILNHPLILKAREKS